ncbi:hypothetical protein BX600DRAFT_508976 [Xylariales sp. PMI_506]|nr:hypothetical protein BX600DRAFT_508976 [Xylariales sp. PMI_506]
MSSPQIGPVLRAWYRWKTLRLPWRKKFLVGLDLQGNTYWVFRDLRDESIPDSAVRWRRIVHYPRSTHYSEVKVPPQWHQWLRHQREHPPTLSEQAEDITRQQRIKLLAAEADARWEAKPKVTDIPASERPPAPLLDVGGDLPRQQPQENVGKAAKSEESHSGKRSVGEKEDPWKRASGPSETWQPESWNPTKARKR